MILENEVIVLLLGVALLVFLLVGRLRIREFPAYRVFLAGLFVLVLGWVLTVLEGEPPNNILNTAEHVCYAASSLLLAAWCWAASGDRRREQR